MIDPTSLTTTTVEEAPKGQPQEAAEVARTAVSPEASEVEAPKGEPQLPEKFRGKSVEDIVKSYENLESEHTRSSQRSKDLEHLVGVYQEAFKKPVQQPQITEDQIFQQEWEQDPKMAVYNQTQRVAQKMYQMNSQTATNLFYQNARNDSNNYPDFERLETKMMDLANRYSGLVNPQKIASPETIDLLYKLARAESMPETLSQAKAQGEREAKARHRETQAAGFESPSPVSSSQVKPEDMTIEQLEKQLGFVDRS